MSGVDLLNVFNHFYLCYSHYPQLTTLLFVKWSGDWWIWAQNILQPVRSFAVQCSNWNCLFFCRCFAVGSKDMSTWVFGAERWANLIYYSLGGHKDVIVACFFEENSLDVCIITQNAWVLILKELKQNLICRWLFWQYLRIEKLQKCLLIALS